MAGLLLAEQIAGAPDVEIVARQHEARAERVQRLQHLEAPLGRRREPRIGGDGEIGVGPDLRPPDPPRN